MPALNISDATTAFITCRITIVIFVIVIEMSLPHPRYHYLLVHDI